MLVRLVPTIMEATTASVSICDSRAGGWFEVPAGDVGIGAQAGGMVTTKTGCAGEGGSSYPTPSQMAKLEVSYEGQPFVVVSRDLGGWYNIYIEPDAVHASPRSSEGDGYSVDTVDDEGYIALLG